MPEYLAPGVFVEEVSFTPSQIQPASTSVAAIVGPTRSGLVRGLPQLLTSFADFQRYYGDANDLNFGGTVVTNYTAYAARAFFDNGGQQLYLARITCDIEAPSGNSPASAALAVPGTNTVLTFGARFPGAAGNVDLVLKPRRSQRLLQPLASAPANATVVLRLTNVPASAMVGDTLAASHFPLQSLLAVATLSTGAPPAQYTFTAGEPIIYVDSAGATHTVQPSAIATGILQSAVPASAVQALTLQVPSGVGATPLYSIPVGANLRAIFNITDATVTTLHGTVSGNNIVLPHALNASLSADVTAPLAVLGMGSRTGDGNLYHDSYDISVQLGGVEIYSFADVDIEPDAANSFANAMPQMPSNSTANAMQPVSANYVGTPTVPAIWGALLGQFDTGALHPTNPAVPPSFVLHLTGGSDGQSPTYADYVGLVDELSGPGHGSFGIAALEAVDEISIVMCPAAAAPVPPTDPSLHQAVISAIQAHCTKMLYRVGVIESPFGASIADAQAFAGQFADTRLAFYYPWVSVASLATTGGNLLLPPSGFLAGLYAYTDITRGVYKAPANVVVQEALGLEVYINTAQQEVLNPLGVNCIRSFPGRGILVWGARTLATLSDPQWMYVNVRRYFLYLEHSIADSTSWVVFEPNGEALWASVATTISDFLYNEWFNGRLLGDRPADAYFVRCDRSTMTQADIDNGRLICVIGVAPLEPAEFVIFRIGQWTASA